MREILFRAKGNPHYNDGDWCYGVPKQCCDGNWKICTDCNRLTVSAETNSNSAFYGFGQFTGIYDSNGTKIFEGDILEGTIHTSWSHRVIRCEVAWNNASANFECRNHINGIDSDYYVHKVKFSKDVKVIGNIYDNADMCYPITQEKSKAGEVDAF